MDKYCELSGKAQDGRPLIHLVEPGTGYGLRSSAGIDKTASGEHLPEVIELIASIRAQPDRLYLVNAALGAGEWVGFNLRGDWFTEKGLLHTPKGWEKIPVWDVEARRRAASTTENVPKWGALAWGYPTFYNAHRFRHHQNSDPAKAYGYVLGAFYDLRMHRVILVSELIREMCQNLGALDLYNRIASGEFPDTSIGIKVPSDVCAICGHEARSPAGYCPHVCKGALPPYGMRAILPDGRMCGVYNHYPRGFDDSFVFIGAERSAKVMANVTDAVRGNRAYTNRLYMPGETLPPKTADAQMTERDERQVNLGRSIAGVLNSRIRGVRERSAAESISQLLSAIPTQGDVEAQALQHAAERERQKAGIVDGTISPDEVDFWEGNDTRRISMSGVSPEQKDRAIALLHDRMDKMGAAKYGTSAKWAEMLKQVPVPSAAQRVLLRDHESRLRRVLPAPVMDACSESPGSFRGMLSHLSHLGIVLRPDEFQDSVLRAEGESGFADHCQDTNTVFAPTPLDAFHEPRWRPMSPVSGILGPLAEILGDTLRGRSFAPVLVSARILVQPSASLAPKLTSVLEPRLNRVSQMYNDYRTGLLTEKLGWSYVPCTDFSATLEAQKVADAAEIVSSLLLQLAYW